MSDAQTGLPSPADRPKVGSGLIVLTGMAVGALLARRADGSSILSIGLLLLTQGPATLLWIIHGLRSLVGPDSPGNPVARPAGLRGVGVDFGLTIGVVIAAAAAAIVFRSLGVFLAATTTFIAGALLLEDVLRLYRRIEAEIAEPDHLLRVLIGPWLGLILVATVLLSLPLATQSGVPDYRHNFWLHILNNAYAAVSSACLVGTTVYGFGTEYSLFGQVVLVLTTQLAGMGLAAVGLAVFRPFMHNAIRLRTVLLFAHFFQLLAIAAMWFSWHAADTPSSWDRFWWGVVHAGSAMWNSGLTMQAGGLVNYFSSGPVFAAITTLAVIGSLGLPIVADLACGVRRASPSAGGAKKGNAQLQSIAPPWRDLVAWEAGTAFALLVVGAVLLFWFETPWKQHASWRLPDSWVPQRPLDLGEGQMALRDHMSPTTRWTSAVFVSSTLRSAGMQSVSVMEGAVSWPTYGLILLWMLIGGSAGGVAGGLRTTCLLAIWIGLVYRRRTWAAHAGGPEVRRILLRAALAFIPIWLLINAASVAALAAVTDATRYEVVFEGVAACNSVGLSTGLSLHLSWFGRMIIILVLVVGRTVPVVFWMNVSRRFARHLRRKDAGRPIRK